MFTILDLRGQKASDASCSHDMFLHMLHRAVALVLSLVIGPGITGYVPQHCAAMPDMAAAHSMDAVTATQHAPATDGHDSAPCNSPAGGRCCPSAAGCIGTALPTRPEYSGTTRHAIVAVAIGAGGSHERRVVAPEPPPPKG